MKKYQRVTRADYEAWDRENREYREKYRENAGPDPFRLSYHLMPETGWLNDPNGLCQKDGNYHIYYQYDPFDSEGELKLWGHYMTRDFIRYKDAGPALFPDSEWDAHGVYSGSAFVENGTIHYYYTGNLKYFDRPDYDYITAGRGSNTLHVTSADGCHFSEKELVLSNRDYPEDVSCHVRDPKVFKRGNRYYMALGARDRESRGAVLLYGSGDLKSWSYERRITMDIPFGYMWECPDLFYLDGELCLIFCPQGVEERGVDFQNVHQCVALRVGEDSGTNPLPPEKAGEARQLDRGCDFYAPQTFEDEKGRRILIGWMGIPDADYTNPTVESGWQHALTIPRELHLRDGRLIQEPLEELKALRRRGKEFSLPLAGEEARAAGDCGLIYEAEIDFDGVEEEESTGGGGDREGGRRNLSLTLRAGVSLVYDEEKGLLSLDLGREGSGRPERSVKLDRLCSLRIFSDASSLEIFVNGGEEVFTTRVYGRKPGFSISGLRGGRLKLHELGGVEISRTGLRQDRAEWEG